MKVSVAASLLTAFFLSACTASVETSPSNTTPPATSGAKPASPAAPAAPTATTATTATTAPAKPTESKVWFEGSFADGLAQARADKKLVFVDVFTTWCGPCKKLEKVTFPHADVSPVLAKMVSMRIDAESPAGQPIAAKYGVNAYPTMIVLDEGGKEIGRLVGFMEPPRFLAELEKVRARSAR